MCHPVLSSDSPTQPTILSPLQATKNSNNSSSSASLSSVADLCDNSVLNYRTSSRIHDYLNSLSQIQQQAKLRYANLRKSEGNLSESGEIWGNLTIIVYFILSPVSPCATSPGGSSTSSSSSPPSSHFSPFEAMSGVSYR